MASPLPSSDPAPSQASPFHSRLALLVSLFTRLSSRPSIKEVCRDAVEATISGLGFHRAGLWLLDQERPGILVGTYGTDMNGCIRDESEVAWRTSLDVPGNQAFVGEWFETMLQDSRAAGHGTLRIRNNAPLYDQTGPNGHVGACIVSILWDGRDALGFMSIDRPGETAVINEEDAHIAFLLGSMLGAILGQRLRLEAENRATELAQAIQQLQSEVEQRRNAELELAQQRNLLRSLIDSLPDRVYIKDQDGRYLVSNRAHWHSLGGRSEKEILGGRVFDYFPGPIAEAYHRRDLEIMQTGLPAENFVEPSLIRNDEGDPDQQWILTSKFPFRDAAGNIIGIVGVSTDYTRKKEADDLRAGHLRYVETLNTLSEVIARNETSEDLLHSVMNLLFERLNCRGLWAFHPIPEDGEFAGLAFWRNCQDSQLAIALSQPQRLKQLMAASGSQLFDESGHSCIGKIVRPKLGDAWGVIATRREETEAWGADDERMFSEIVSRFGDALNRIMLREQLEESEMRHRALFENSIDGIYRCSPEGRFLEINRSFVQMLGYDGASDVLAINPEELVFQPIQFDLAAEHVAESCELRRRNGEHLFIEVSTHAVMYASGDVAHFEGIVRDISDRKRIQEAMLNTQKLESLGVLAGGIAHDFNNLLAVILGNADLARSEIGPNSPIRESIEQIELASRRGSELCKQMLAYSGKGHFVIQPLNMNEVVSEMTHLLEISINKGVIMRYRMFNHLPPIMGDATQICQVIMNLVINASDAIGDNSGIITVSTGVMSADSGYLTEAFLADALPSGDYVYLEISDTGVGMDAETQARIFDPFFSTKFTGRGLGLAAVLGIVRGHKGALKVYSERGVGSSFKVLIPATGVPLVADAPVEDPYKTATYTGVALVVDDELPVRTMARRMVEKLGFEALSADNGAEGVQLYRENSHRIRFVLLDMTMPVMTGDGAFREMIRINPEAKVILTSGYNEEEATARFAGKGLAGFLQKPFRLAELRAAVENAIGFPL